MTEESIPIVLVSGLAGAGRSSILRTLEDLGFQAVDNLPMALLPTLMEESRKEGARLAVGIDTRTKGFDPASALQMMEDIERQGASAHLVVATSSNDVLLRRFTETRRRHPLAPDGQVIDGINAERALIEPLQAAADLVIDTSDLPLAGLRQAVEQRYGHATMGVTLMSFAFPAGLPREADMVFDARFLRNPHYDQALRPLTGLDTRVAAYVEDDPDFDAFFSRITDLLALLLPRFMKEGKKYAVVAVGCSGGKHRSVHIVQRLAEFLGDLSKRTVDRDEFNPEWKISVIHRELAKAGIRAINSDPARTA